MAKVNKVSQSQRRDRIPRKFETNILPSPKNVDSKDGQFSFKQLATQQEFKSTNSRNLTSFAERSTHQSRSPREGKTSSRHHASYLPYVGRKKNKAGKSYDMTSGAGIRAKEKRNIMIMSGNTGLASAQK